MIPWLIISKVVIVLLIISSPAFSGELWINGRYSFIESKNQIAFVSPTRKLSSGSYTTGFGMDLYSPDYKKFQLFLSYEYYGNYFAKDQPMYIKFSTVSFGIGHSFNVGYSKIAVIGGASYYTDEYEIRPVAHDYVTVNSSSWGGMYGFDIRFQFIGKLDSIIGYRLYFRDRKTYSGFSPGGIPYDLDGIDMHQNFSIGIGYRFGGV